MNGDAIQPLKTPKLMDQVNAVLRASHYSLRTETACLGWIRQFILYHKKRHPMEMGEEEINDFLKHLAVQKNVSSSTQNQALCAIVYLYKHVLNKEIGGLKLIWAEIPQCLKRIGMAIRFSLEADFRGSEKRTETQASS